MSAVDFRQRVRELARFESSGSPVVSVYLNTEWVDEHQRERVRIFVKNALAEARGRRWADRDDLDWIERQSGTLIERAVFEDAHGAVLFACGSASLRELLPLRVPFDDTFVVDARPYVRPLAGIVDDTPPALIVFADGVSARLIALDASGVTGETVLEAEVPGRHESGGWADLAQSRYERHILEHREQHFAAVAAAIGAWTERHDAHHIVLAAEPRSAAALRKHLPDSVAARIAGVVAGARHESSPVIADRAAGVLARVAQQADERRVDEALADAAEGSTTVAGVAATVGAVNRNAVRHLYVLTTFREPGAVCQDCGALQRGVHFTCPFCGRGTRTTELGEALVERVLASGGEVTTLESHRPLAGHGGVVARLRYAA